MNSKLKLLQASDQAERAWVAEIVVVFGEREAAIRAVGAAQPVGAALGA